MQPGAPKDRLKPNAGGCDATLPTCSLVGLAEPEAGPEHLAAVSGDRPGPPTCTARPASNSPAGGPRQGCYLQLGLHTYQVGRQHAGPTPPVHSWSARTSAASACPPNRCGLGGAGVCPNPFQACPQAQRWCFDRSSRQRSSTVLAPTPTLDLPSMYADPVAVRFDAALMKICHGLSAGTSIDGRRNLMAGRCGRAILAPTQRLRNPTRPDLAR